jgi:hypothetical protein
MCLFDCLHLSKNVSTIRTWTRSGQRKQVRTRYKRGFLLTFFPLLCWRLELDGSFYLVCWFARKFGTGIITCLYDQLPDYSPEKHRMSEDRRSGPEHRAGGFHCTHTHTHRQTLAHMGGRTRTHAHAGIHTDTRRSMRTHKHTHRGAYSP